MMLPLQQSQNKCTDNKRSDMICDTFTLTSFFCDVTPAVEVKTKNYYNIVLMNGQSSPFCLHSFAS